MISRFEASVQRFEAYKRRFEASVRRVEASVRRVEMIDYGQLRGPLAGVLFSWGLQSTERIRGDAPRLACRPVICPVGRFTGVV